MTNFYNNFARTQLMIGKENLDKLKNAKIAVVGLGAVGSFAIEALARSGVSNFVLFDFDKIQRSNFNRQLFATESTLDFKKCEAAKSRILDINKEAHVVIHDIFLHHETFKILLNENPDIVIDAIDSLTPKVSLLEFLYKNSIPVISSMGAARKKDPTKIKIADISKTKNCMLAKNVRGKLRALNIKRGIKCVSSEELSHNSNIDNMEESSHVSSDYKRGRDRKPMPSFSYLTGMFGLYIAYDVLNTILSSHQEREQQPY